MWNVFSFLYEHLTEYGGSLIIQGYAAPKFSWVGGQYWMGPSSPVTLSLKGCEDVERKLTLGLGTDLGEHPLGERARRSGIGLKYQSGLQLQTGEAGSGSGSWLRIH